MQKEIAELSKIQSDISSFQKQQGAVEATRSKLAVLQQQYDNIQREINETEGFSSSLENKLLSKQQQIEKTSAALGAQTDRLEKMENALKAAGVNTDTLSDKSAELTAEMNALKKKQEEAAEGATRFGENSVSALEAAGAALAAAGLAKAFEKISEEIIECVKASVEFESEQTGVFKTVDGTEAELLAITKEIKNMTTEIPATTTEIAAVAEAAGQLGVATNDVMDFTQVMINLGESTNLTADDAASSFAKFANITGTASENYSRLGSVVVDLGNNFATTEADIVSMSTRLASAGTLAGFSEAEIMALSAAMSSVGIEAEAGGTAMTQTFSSIEKAVETQNENLLEFARVAEMSADEFSAAWKTSPVEALQAFISGLGRLDSKGESSVLVLENLGLTGIRQTNMLKSLGLAAETLGEAVSTANKAWNENTALTAEANKRYETTAAKLQMLQNTYGNLQAAIGDVYTPTVAELAEVGTDVLKTATEFIEQNPDLVRAITALGIGVGGFSAALVGYVAVSKLAKAATDALTASMKANPYLLAASAIVGVVSALGSLTVLMKNTKDETEDGAKALRELTETSRQEYFELQKLQTEYNALTDGQKANSQEAALLAWEIENLNSRFEANKQTLSEYVEERKAAYEETANFVEETKRSIKEIQQEELVMNALINRLRELAPATDDAVLKQEEARNIVETLNAAFPHLALSYSEVAKNVDDYASAMETANAIETKRAEKKLKQEAVAKAEADLVQREKERADAVAQHESALKRLADAQSAYNRKLGESANAENGIFAYGIAKLNAYLSDEGKELRAAEEALVTYNDKIKESEEAIAKYNAVIAENKAVYDYLNDSAVIENVTESIQILALSYSECYAEMKEIFAGQFDLFSEAQANADMTVANAQAAMNSQLTFWQNYADNISILRSVSADDLGVTQTYYEEIIAYAQSGTQEAAGFAASLAEAVNSGNTQAIAKLAETVGEVKAARELAAGEVTAWQVDFEGQMQAIISAMENGLAQMDMSEEAIEAAKSTMSSYAEQIASDGVLAVQNAVKVAEQVRAALEAGSANLNIDINAYTTETYGPAYAAGTSNATPGWHLVGEKGPEIVYFGGGETVFPSDETRRMLNGAREEIQMMSLLPLYQHHLTADGISAFNSSDTVGAVGLSGQQNSITIAPQFTVQGGNASEIEDRLREFSDMLIENVMDALEESGIDKVRRAYN
ncbi:MAG: phage tail tape measure protein [Clostridia bacterium]|nr:phage tail tape measure protein [Clostridia bacterium]